LLLLSFAFSSCTPTSILRTTHSASLYERPVNLDAAKKAHAEFRRVMREAGVKVRRRGKGETNDDDEKEGWREGWGKPRRVHCALSLTPRPPALSL